MRKVILIEDNDDIREMIAEQLDGSGTAFSNAGDAAEHINPETVAAVYCDFHGIENNGHDYHTIASLCKKLKIPCFCISSECAFQQVYKGDVAKHAQSILGSNHVA